MRNSFAQMGDNAFDILHQQPPKTCMTSWQMSKSKYVAERENISVFLETKSSLADVYAKISSLRSLFLLLWKTSKHRE